MRSFIIVKENGRETIRNARHIKFEARKEKTKVRFAEILLMKSKLMMKQLTVSTKLVLSWQTVMAMKLTLKMKQMMSLSWLQRAPQQEQVQDWLEESHLCRGGLVKHRKKQKEQ